LFKLAVDTRSKIISIEEARQRATNARTLWLSGHFDPLLAEHARRLREHVAPGQKLIVEITNSANPLLPQRARAELVAALESVDYVVLGNGAQSDDASITERFIEHVLNRHRAESSQ
jgi:bifunctional ADP-heptose synthase (sugar kinase/adenylyltransferase)